MKKTNIPVVLIHGYPLSSKIWRDQAALAERHAIFVPDLPGFGHSPVGNTQTMVDYASWISQYLDKNKLEQVVVVGHSMGGYIALEFANRFPERIAGLGLVNTQAGADSEDGRKNRFANIDRIKKEGSGFVFEAMRDKLLAPGSSFSSEVIAIMKESSSDGMINALHAMANRSDQLEFLSTFGKPVLIVSGKQDQLISPDKSRLMAERLTHCRLVEFDQCGHLSMMEHAEAFNKSLIEFLDSLPNS